MATVKHLEPVDDPEPDWYDRAWQEQQDTAWMVGWLITLVLFALCCLAIYWGAHWLITHPLREALV